MGNETFRRYQQGESQQGLLSAEAFGHTSVPNPGPMNLSLQDYARFLVMVYINGERKKAGQAKHRFSENEVLLVWFSKTLENWKALVITTFPDQKYYEVTHSGAKKETYLDEYEKIANVCFPDEE